jgi:predicted Zn-dependent protease
MLDAGCSFADARLYNEDRTERLTLYDGNLETNYGANERGIGVRALYKGAWGFAATADLASIPACFDKALANAKAATLLPGFPKDMGPAQPTKGEYRPPVKQDPFEVPMSDKLALLSGIDAKLKHSSVAHRYVTAGFQRRKIFYWNSEGTEVDRGQSWRPTPRAAPSAGPWSSSATATAPAAGSGLPIPAPSATMPNASARSFRKSSPPTRCRRASGT